MSTPRHHFLSHTAIYLVARGLPGLVAFLAIPIFSRLLNQIEYGKYALVLVSVNLLNALLFQWVRLSLVRYLPAYREDGHRFKSTLITTSLLMVIVLGIIAGVLCLLPLGHQWSIFIVPCWIMLASQAGFELCCEHARAELRPWNVMRLQLARAASTVVLGVVFVWLGLGWWGPVGGTIGGMLLASLFLSHGAWGGLRLQIDPEIFKRVARYGIPLSMTVALLVVVAGSDRFLIAWFLGEAKAGVYSVAVDFTSQTLTLLLMVVNMAMFPLAVRALELHGVDAAREQMRYNASLLLAIGVPCVVGFVFLAPGIAHTFIGKDFRDPAAHIIPLIALGAFLAGLKAYHFDAAFQFADRTLYQVWIILAAAVLNFILNLIAIPRWGINGSAIASVVAYMLSIGLTAWIGRRSFPLPFPADSFAVVLLSAGAMALFLLPIRTHTSPIALAGQVVGGMAIYGGGMLLMNFLGSRDQLVRRWRNRLDPESNQSRVQLVSCTVGATVGEMAGEQA
jgi:O-antigen/teichoic acid export membrane protein